MTGEKALDTLIANMKPKLQDGEFVFCSISPEMFDSIHIKPLGVFREQEGVTLIIEKNAAENIGLKSSSIFRMISLTVHSSLNAVGFLAVITQALSKAGISVNPVSAYYHDHLFVPSENAELAMQVLKELSEE